MNTKIQILLLIILLVSCKERESKNFVTQVLKTENEISELPTQTNEISPQVADLDQITILAFKEEQILQVYSINSEGNHLIKEFPFTRYVGNLGPKLRVRDYQIPEGIYKITELNPESKYHLSLKINYPNSFDIAKSKLTDKSNLGGNIYIHGGSETIGCIPIGDYAIEDLYELAKQTFDNEIKVIISPRDFRKQQAFPDIETIDWEEELYDLISEALEDYPVGN